MNETIDDLGLDESELEVVQDPYSHDFRPEDPEVYSFELEESLFEEVEADLGNENVRIIYSDNGSLDTYVQVFGGENFALVENHDRDGELENYYLVTDDEILVNNEEGYQSTPNVRPIQVSEAADYFLEKAKNGEEGLEINTDFLEGSE